MAVDLWSSRLHSAKHFFHAAARINPDSHSSRDDSEGDDDVRAASFPCPFCNVDIDVHVLCSHLQDEHCFDLRNAVCPICAANLGKDVTGHFVVQHASSLMRRRKSQKSGLLTGSLGMLGKELSLFLGSSTNDMENTHESPPDSLFSPFVCSGPPPDPKGIQQDESSNDVVSVTADLKSSQLSLLDEDHEHDIEERRQRAAFVIELFASSIF
ncbi:Di19 domain-containing protein [Cephalotus follicularis]|uniref:Di19 domain-containing protein n=1 Tax=Cephalotus follicularis TaxID=3775 RepID=A0A1Q3BAY2_CEPFO|nr:Di19 domain-containing protein [Cephalotus follicularis]